MNSLLALLWKVSFHFEGYWSQLFVIVTWKEVKTLNIADFQHFACHVIVSFAKVCRVFWPSWHFLGFNQAGNELLSCFCCTLKLQEVNFQLGCDVCLPFRIYEGLHCNCGPRGRSGVYLQHSVAILTLYLQWCLSTTEFQSKRKTRITETHLFGE